MKTVVAIVIFMTIPLQAEVVMVWNKKVDLYSEGRIAASLRYGEVVDVSQHPREGSAVVLKRDGKNYSAAASGFRTIADVTVNFKKRALELDAERQKHANRLSQIDSELLLMYVQAVEIRRDTALAYRVLAPVITAAGRGYGYSYSSLLSESKARKLLKKWQADVEILEKEKESLSLADSKLRTERVSLASRLKSLEASVAGLTSGGEGSSLQNYFVTSDRTPLYFENKVKSYLKSGFPLQGKPHPRFGNWHEIHHKGKVYSVNSKFLATRAQFSGRIEAAGIAAAGRITLLEQQVKMLQFRLKLYAGVSRQLQAERTLQHGYAMVKNIQVQIDKDHTVTINSPNANGVFANSTRAKKVLREWEGRIKELGKSSLEKQQEILDLKKQQVDQQKALRDFEKKVAAAK